MAKRLDHELARAAADVLRDQHIGPELRTRMRGLPALLQTSGLAATCAFLLSRVKPRTEAGEPPDPYWLTARSLLDEAAKEAGIEAHPKDPWVTLDRISLATGRQYVIAETRAAMLAMWLSRLTQAKATAQQESRS